MKDKKLIAFKICSAIIIILAWIASILLLKYNAINSILIIISLVLVTGVFLLQLFYIQRNTYRFIADINQVVSKNDANSMYLFPAPITIVNDNGKIIWYNKAFTKEIEIKDVFGKEIQRLTDVDWNELMKNKSANTLYNNKSYKLRLVSKISHTSTSDVHIVYFDNITDYIEIKKSFENSRPSIMLILIDNYEDLLQNVKESEKAHILVTVEQLLEEFISDTNGILRKVSNDKFIAVIEEQHLLKMIDERFKILDKARTITVGERMSVTLSIGVGHGAKTLSESELFAKQALDMSLGRGGDQVAVKTENGFQFFGGVSKGIEKQSKIKSRIISTALQELINNSEKVFIMGHSFSDLDAMGSALGLAGAINKMGKPAFVVADRKRTLAKTLIDKVIKIEGAQLFKDVPDAVGEISPTTLLIIVDTHNKDFIESKELYEKAKQVVVIDHHRKTVNFIDNAVIFHHEPYASSASEMVSEIIQYFPNLGKLHSCYADALLAGITLDTRNFIIRTGVRTFEAAAFLKRMGADTVSVKALFSNSIQTYQRKSELVSSAEIYNQCAIASTTIQSEDIRIVSPQAADELLNITDVRASFVIFMTKDCVNISARSMGLINVQLIMEKLGGGGHQTMAATQIYNSSIDAAKQLLISAIDDYLESLQN